MRLGSPSLMAAKKLFTHRRRLGTLLFSSRWLLMSPIPGVFMSSKCVAMREKAVVRSGKSVAAPACLKDWPELVSLSLNARPAWPQRSAWVYRQDIILSCRMKRTVERLVTGVRLCAFVWTGWSQSVTQISALRWFAHESQLGPTLARTHSIGWMFSSCCCIPPLLSIFEQTWQFSL